MTVKYQVSLSTSSYQVGLPKTSKRLVDVGFNQYPGNLADLDDIDQTNKKEGYVLMWNDSRGIHEYVPPFEVVDRSDSDDPVQLGDNAIDYGTY
jgi:hypothetical protein